MDGSHSLEVRKRAWRALAPTAMNHESPQTATPPSPVRVTPSYRARQKAQSLLPSAEREARRNRERLAEVHRYREGSVMVVECSWGPVTIRPRK
jgi:hypothetical protein